MPSAARAWRGSAARSCPSKVMRPCIGFRWPITVRINVVLPAPLRPTSPTIVPSATVSDRPRSATTVWIDTWMPSIVSTANPSSFLQQLAGDVAAHVVGGQRLVGHVVGDDAAAVERDHAVGVALDDVHVVLDEQHRG